MPLKNLVAQKAIITEAAIEEIIAKYARYDIDESVIVFTPAAAELSNKGKILVYLVALQGWPYVSESEVSTEAKPAIIEETIGIIGGTLRPVLKDLKDRHVILQRGGAYSVKSSSLDAIRVEIGMNEGNASTPRKRKGRKKPSAAKAGGDVQTDSSKRKTPAKKRPAASGQAEAFDSWLMEGFFDEPRTLADVQQRFHEEGILVPQSNLPKHLLRGVRNKRVTRRKQEVKGKRVWVYETKK